MTVPHGYTRLAGARVRAIVRSDLVRALSGWVLAARLETPAAAEALRAGRGAAWRLTLPGGARAVLRRYRRGGLLARLVRDTYLGVRERPFHELIVTTEARRRGVAAPEVLAARVEGWLVYRGAIVTAEVPDAVTLPEALRAMPPGAARQALAAAAGRMVGRMHGAGIWHADLNLTNLLAPAAGGEVVVLDFDRARLMSGPLGRRDRRQNLRRLGRSLRKLDPAGELVDADDVAAFHAAYAAEERRTCGY